MGSVVSTVNSIFDANYIGIKLGSGLAWNAVTFTIADTRFTCSNNLPLNCPNWPLFGTRPLAGILANRIGTLNMTPFIAPSIVTFDNLNNGIVSINENCIVNSCRFEAIKNYDNYSFVYQGCGVYADGAHANFLDVNGNVNSAIYVDFNDCLIGIRYKSIEARIGDVIMEKILDYGILGDVTLGQSSIADCEISSFKHGIFMNDISRILDLYITENTINLNLIPLSQPNNGEAIHVDAIKPFSQYFEITNNTITLNNGNIGIHSNGIQNNFAAFTHRIFSNIIEINVSSLAAIGIFIEDNNFIDVECNEISTLLPPSVINNHTAIIVLSSPNSLIGCNVLRNTFMGLRILGACNNSGIGENHFNSHTFGLVYENTAVVGVQNYMGNTWNNLCTTLDAINNNPNLIPNRYFYDGTSTLQNYIPQNVFPTIGWFIPSLGSDASTCPEYVPLGQSCTPQLNEDTIELDLANRVANGEFLTSEFEEGISEKERELLYHHLKDGQLNTNASSSINNFYFSNLNSKYNKYYSIINETKNIDLSYQSDYYSISSYRQDYLSASAMAHLVFESLDSNSNMIDLHNAILNYNFNISQTPLLSAEAPSWQTGVLTQINQAHQNIEDDLNNIFETDIYAENRKTAWLIANKIQKSGIESLLQNEIEFINILAFECPLIMGDGVFIAQRVYNLINTVPSFFNNQTICDAAGTSYKQSQLSSTTVSDFESISLKPNDLFSLNIIKADFFDITGRHLLSLSKPQSIYPDLSKICGQIIVVRIFKSNGDIEYKKITY